MLASIVKGHLKVKIGAVKQLFANLTRNSQILESGMKDEMYGKLQIDLELPEEELEKLVEIFNRPLH